MRKLRKPSPAMAVAITALCVSLVGTAVAAPIAVISLSKQDKKQVRKISGKIANKRITKRAPGLSVNHANSADFASSAGIASTADHAKTADSSKTADSATNATNATNASLLGGTPASGFQTKILTAVVTNNGSTAAVVRGTPGTSAQKVALGDVFVKFPVDVSECTWIATVGNPGSTTAPPDFTSVRGNSSQGPLVVQVLTWDTSGSEVAANFHLAAIC
jgi:hypothetical protein